jgi:hypothetical protein
MFDVVLASVAPIATRWVRLAPAGVSELELDEIVPYM